MTLPTNWSLKNPGRFGPGEPEEAEKRDTIITSEGRRLGKQKDRESKVQANRVIPKVLCDAARRSSRPALSPMMISEALYTMLCMVFWYTADGTSYL